MKGVAGTIVGENPLLRKRFMKRNAIPFSNRTKVLALATALTSFSFLSVSCMSTNVMELLEQDTATAVVEKQDVINSINVSGTVEGSSLVNVTTTLIQKVESLHVDIGSYVKKGDVLCVFDSSELQKQYDELKKTMDNSDALKEKNQEITQRNLENAKKEKTNMLAQAQRAIDDAVKARDTAYQRYNSLVSELNSISVTIGELEAALANAADEFEQASIAGELELAKAKSQAVEQEIDMLNSQFATYDSAIQSARDAYAATERTADSSIQSIQDTIDMGQYETQDNFTTQLESLAKSIEECTVIAPKDGLVTALNITEGSIPTKESLMTIEDDSQLKITVQIKETDILNVKEGMEVIVQTTATGDEEFTGKVSRVVNIYSGADPYSGAEGGYTAEITIDSKGTNLLIGMNAKAKIILERSDDVIAVPYDAIDENDDGETVVYVAEKNDEGLYIAHAVPVEIGIESGYYTEILSGDLQEGDVVVLDPLCMEDGAELRITDDEEATN